MILRYFLPRGARAYIDSLSGITVALALIPEAIAFALVAHVSPLIGLFAAFFMCTIPALIGGRPGMISGATGATAVVMVSLVLSHGTAYLFAAIILAGFLQVVLGFLRVGQAVNFFSKSLMIGFVNGLAIIIFVSQLHQFKHIVAGHEQWLPGPALLLMLALVALSLLVIWIVPKLSKKIPAALSAIVVVTAVVGLLGLHTRIVSDMLQGASMSASFPVFSFPRIPLNWDSLSIIFPYSIILAIVGLSETMITQRLIDERTETKSQPNRECVAQGIANAVSGFFGTMGGCAMIGQSMINITSGARGRLSGIVAGGFLLVFVMLAWPFIRLIPLAALVGVMYMVVFKTFDWQSLKLINKIPTFDAAIILVVMAVTVAVNLAAAVVVGAVMAAIKFCLDSAQNTIVSKDAEGNYRVSGALYFVSSHAFKNAFNYKVKREFVTIDLEKAMIYDHTAIDALAYVVSEFKKNGVSVRLVKVSPSCQRHLRKAKFFPNG
jgi:sulfate permease, SulP family